MIILLVKAEWCGAGGLQKMSQAIKSREIIRLAFVRAELIESKLLLSFRGSFLAALANIYRELMSGALNKTSI